MKRTPPPELEKMGLDAEHFKYSDARSMRGPCPECKDHGHRRFVVFTDNPWPLYHGYCDSCGYTVRAWELESVEITDEQREEYRKRAMTEEKRREYERLMALRKFTETELWEELHGRLREVHRLQWESWGVPREWQDELDLGFTPDKCYRDKDGNLKHTAAYTIPYFHYDKTKERSRSFQTLQYRLFEAPNSEDRYRFEKGLGTTYYMTTPSVPIADQVIVCEGVKKAIVVRTKVNKCVLAVPAKGSWGGIVEAVKGCGRVWVLLDPDAIQQAAKMANQIGKSARIVKLPIKADDFFILNGGTVNEFVKMFKRG